MTLLAVKFQAVQTGRAEKTKSPMMCTLQ